MASTMNRWLLTVFALAAMGFVFIGEDAREPHGPLPIDRSVLRFALDHRTPPLVAVARLVSHLGDPLTLTMMALVTTAFLWARRRSILEAVPPIIALIFAGALEYTIKQIIGRPRPPAIYRLVSETNPSFPSGHATGSAAFFVALALVVSPHLGTTVGRVILLLTSGVLAATISFSRVVLGVHWVTDVVGGWLLGVAVALGVVLMAQSLALSSRWKCHSETAAT